MKFFAVALAALVGLTDAAKLNNKQLDRRMKNGAVRKALMHGAKPYDAKTKQRLLEEGEQAFEITGMYSIQFDSCISMTVQNEDILADANLAEMAANGDLISEKDFIIFKVCLTASCAYDAEDDKLTFVTDVGTYFQSLSQYLPQKIAAYCEGCVEQYNYCYTTDYLNQTYYPEGYEEAAAEGEEAEGEGEGGRKLRAAQVVQMIDCAVCKEYECLDFYQANYVAAADGERRLEEAAAEQQDGNGYYNENNEWVEVDLDDAMEWLNGFSECAATYGYLDEYVLYSSLMCNEDGDGIEIGLFLDDACLMYTPKIAYKDVMQESDTMFYNMIANVVEFTFTSVLECYDPEVIFYNEVDYAYQQQNNAEGEQEQEQDGEVPEAAEWCQGLMEHDGAVSLADCGGYEEAEEGGEEQEVDVDEYVSEYSWYNYELYAEQSEDLQAVCQVMHAWEGEFHTSYNGENGHLFDYKRGKTASSSGMSGGAIAGIVLLVLALVGAGAYGFVSYQKKASDGKKKPLITGEGTLA